jgi:hypothetical protein
LRLRIECILTEAETPDHRHSVVYAIAELDQLNNEGGLCVILGLEIRSEIDGVEEIPAVLHISEAIAILAAVAGHRKGIWSPVAERKQHMVKQPRYRALAAVVLPEKNR